MSNIIPNSIHNCMSNCIPNVIPNCMFTFILLKEYGRQTCCRSSKEKRLQPNPHLSALRRPLLTTRESQQDNGYPTRNGWPCTNMR